METAKPTMEYEDDQVTYLGGDPRLESSGSAIVKITCQEIRITMGDDVICIPCDSIVSARTSTERLGMEQAEIELGEQIGPDEWMTRYVVVVQARDPENVMPKGFRIRLGFRNEYHARVFEKKCRKIILEDAAPL